MLQNILNMFFKVGATGLVGSTGLFVETGYIGESSIGYDYTGIGYDYTGIGYDYTGIEYAPTENPSSFIKGSSSLKGSSSPLESLKYTETKMPEPELEILNPLRKIQW